MKGQSSVEFILILSLLSVIFAITVSYFANYSLYSNNYLSEESYRLICAQVKDELDAAFSSGPDYERAFYLPAGNYNASIYDREIKVSYSGGAVSCYTYANITKFLSIGKNTVIYNETGLFVR